MDFFQVWFVADPDPTPPFAELLLLRQFRDGSDVDIWAYTRCQRVEPPRAVPYRFGGAGPMPDFSYDVFSGVIASARLSRAFAEFGGDDVQLIPAAIPGHDGFHVVNVLACVDAIDHDRSVIQYRDLDETHRPGEPRGVVRLVIDPAKAEGRHVFRLHEWRVALIVSEDFKLRVEAEQMTNMEFTCVTPDLSEDWRLKLAARQTRPPRR